MSEQIQNQISQLNQEIHSGLKFEIALEAHPGICDNWGVVHETRNGSQYACTYHQIPGQECKLSCHLEESSAGAAIQT